MNRVNIGITKKGIKWKNSSYYRPHKTGVVSGDVVIYKPRSSRMYDENVSVIGNVKTLTVGSEYIIESAWDFTIQVRNDNGRIITLGDSDFIHKGSNERLGIEV